MDNLTLVAEGIWPEYLPVAYIQYIWMPSKYTGRISSRFVIHNRFGYMLSNRNLAPNLKVSLLSRVSLSVCLFGSHFSDSHTLLSTSILKILQAMCVNQILQSSQRKEVKILDMLSLIFSIHYFKFNINVQLWKELIHSFFGHFTSCVSCIYCPCPVFFQYFHPKWMRCVHAVLCNDLYMNMKVTWKSIQNFSRISKYLQNFRNCTNDKFQILCKGLLQ